MRYWLGWHLRNLITIYQLGKYARLTLYRSIGIFAAWITSISILLRRLAQITNVIVTFCVVRPS